jgi:co-chaperonin GroES (HSP10)
MIKPINSYILIKVCDEEETTKSGLIISNNNERNIKKGLVVEINSKSELKKGNIIFFNISDTECVNYKKEKYYLIQEDKVLAIIEGE